MPFLGQPSESPGRGKRIAILAAVLILLAGSLGYNLWRAHYYNVKPYQQKLGDLIVRWRCVECGHETEDAAGPGPKACPKCQKAGMYVHCAYLCPRHGTKQVALQYDQHDRIAQVKVENGPWVPAFDAEGREGTRCPECALPMAGVEGGRRRNSGEAP